MKRTSIISAVMSALSLSLVAGCDPWGNLPRGDLYELDDELWSDDVVAAQDGLYVRLPHAGQLLRLTGERDAFGIHTQAYYDRALRLFLPDQVRLLMAYYQEQPLAGLAVYGFNGQAWYMYGASSNAHRELMPNHQLQWRAMQWARQQGCSQYDLWGITDRDTEEGDALATLSGVERFKAGFGGEVVRFVGAYERAYVRPLHWVMGRALATKAGHG